MLRGLHALPLVRDVLAPARWSSLEERGVHLADEAFKTHLAQGDASSGIHAHLREARLHFLCLNTRSRHSVSIRLYGQ